MQQVSRQKDAMRRFLARVPAFKGNAVPAVSSTSTAGSPRGNTELGNLLRRVTHTECAAVPAEALQKVVRSACESEDALAIVLRHVEANVAAHPLEWRRIHGALAILERLVRPGAGDQGSGSKAYDDEGLVGRVWYEAKLESKLKDLASFEHPEDRRIGTLIRRAAASAQRTAEQYFRAEQEEHRRNDSRFIPAADRSLDNSACDSSSEKHSQKQAPSTSCSSSQSSRECAEDKGFMPAPATIGRSVYGSKLETLPPYNFTRTDVPGEGPTEAKPRSCCCWRRCFPGSGATEEAPETQRSRNTSYESENDMLIHGYTK